MSKITQLNYSSKAIEYLAVTSAGLKKYPKSHNALNLICSLLDRAEKFIMPNCCDLIEWDKFNAEDYALLKAPYPITVFEAPWVKETEIGMPTKLDILASKRRIALLVETSNSVLEGLMDIDGNDISKKNGVLLIPVYSVANEWQTTVGGIFLPYDVDASTLKYDPSSIMARRALDYVESGLVKADNLRIACTPVILLPELYELMAKEIGHEATINDLIDNSRDEILMTVQACAIINCENIESVPLEISPKLQKARAKSGKPPLHEYKVLGIGEDFYYTSHGASDKNRNGPRMHKRRGHVRRYKETGKSIWVRHAVVNAGAKHSVSKTYSVKPRGS